MLFVDIATYFQQYDRTLIGRNGRSQMDIFLLILSIIYISPKGTVMKTRKGWHQIE